MVSYKALNTKIDLLHLLYCKCCKSTHYLDKTTEFPPLPSYMPLEPEGSTLIVASEELSVVCRGVSNQMGHLNLLIRFAAQPKGNHCTIFDNQLSLLQARYRGFYFQEFLA